MRGRLSSLRARVAAWPPGRTDAALATLLLGEALVEGLLASGTLGARLAVALPAALVACAVALRRREPLLAVVLAVGGVGTVDLLQAPVRDALQGVYFGWLFVTYTFAARETGTRLGTGIAITLAGTAGIVAVAEEGTVTDFLLGLVLFVAGPILAGRLLHNRVRLSQALSEKAQRSEHERRKRAEEAAEEERNRIAGELHDVVAHALGAMTIQAAAARRLATRDAARAAGALEAVEHTGREALGELRTLLDVLRAGEEDDPSLEPQPGLSALPELVARVRRAGLPVDLEIHGTAPPALPTGVDLTAYRVVQEALDAALEQGRARRAQVWVGYDRDCVQLRVCDDGHDDCRRLLGMRERVLLYGGHCSAGADAGGRHEVRASLPVEGAHA